MNVAQETLDFRWTDFPSVLSLLMPTSAFPSTPASLAGHLRSRWNAPLPRSRLRGNIRSFGTGFSPEYYRRRVA